MFAGLFQQRNEPLDFARGFPGQPQQKASPLPLPACCCGRSGCIETYLCAAGLEREHRSLTGEERSAREVALLDGEAISRYVERLARSLAGVINLLDPDVIVLGGGMSNAPELPNRLSAIVPRYVLAAGAASTELTTRIVRAVHGDSSGVRGAAWLWRPEEAP